MANKRRASSAEKKRLIDLVKALAGDSDEIVVNCFIDDQIIDSIQLLGEDDFIICIWEGDIEYQIDSEQLTKNQILDLIEQLEEVLRN